MSPAVPQVVKSCADFIEKHGVVDGIYRLSGISSNIQKLRCCISHSYRAGPSSLITSAQLPHRGLVVVVAFYLTSEANVFVWFDSSQARV